MLMRQLRRAVVRAAILPTALGTATAAASFAAVGGRRRRRIPIFVILAALAMANLTVGAKAALAQDLNAPVLLSAATTPNRINVGTTGTFTWTVDRPVSEVDFVFHHTGFDSTTWDHVPPPGATSGTLSVGAGPDDAGTTVTLDSISITSAANGVTATYHHDGTITYNDGSPPDNYGDLTTADYTVPPTAPAAPTGVIGTARNGAADVTWQAAKPHGSPVTRYVITATPAGTSSAVVVDGNTTQAHVDGLTNGTSYTFSVVATNDYGDSSAGTSDPVTPDDVPAAPTGIKARPGVNQATVSWTPATSPATAPVTSYTATSTPGNKTCTVAATAGNACAVNGLTNGQPYTFTVTASNRIGSSAPSTASGPATPATDTTAPTIVSATVTPGRVSSLGGAVTVELHLSDNLSGVTDDNYVLLKNTATSKTVGFSYVPRVAGDGYDGTYRATIQVPAGTPIGSYKLEVYPVTDNAGNSGGFSFFPGISVGTPSAVTDVTATADPDRNVTVSWAAPADDGGNIITGYQVTSTPGGPTFTTSAPTLTTAQFRDWPADTPVVFHVTAQNAAGSSSPADSAPLALPAVAPSAPASIGATPANESVRVSWAAPASTGGDPNITYTATASPGGASCTTTALSCAISGLTNGQSYVVTLIGHNRGGDSPASAPSSQVTPAGVPDKPTTVTATRADKAATVSWTAPSGNGSPVTSYTITAAPGGKTITVPADQTTATVSGLTNGTDYTFTVTATNTIGDSAASDPSNQVTPAGVPDKPITVTATRADKAATVSWTAPSGNGSPVTSYTITAAPGGKTITVPADQTTATVSGLTNGTDYTFTVTATNTIGDSAASDPSNQVTPGPPDTAGPVVSGFDFTPKNVDVHDGDKQVTVSVHLTDDTGAKAPYVVLGSDNTTQTLGFGQMTLTSGTPKDGTYQRTVTIPTTAAPGTWHVTLYPVSDTLGNDGPSFQDHPTKLTVTNTPPASVPDKPSSVTAVRGDKAATVSWTAPSGNGSPVTSYTITSQPGGRSVSISGDAHSGTVTSLTNGTGYTFTVTATNTIGDSRASDPSNQVTPAGAPDKPTSVTASRGDKSATVSWTAPSGNGSPVTGYTITAAPGGKTLTVPADQSSATVPGLTNGTDYTFTVVATNTVGDSPVSDPSNQVNPTLVVPQTSIGKGPVDHSFVLSTDATFGYSSSEVGSTFSCVLDGAPRSCGSTSVRLVGLSQRTHVVSVAARDQDGDVDPTPTTRVWTVPRNDTSLATSTGWSRRSGSGYYLGSYSQTSKQGAVLSTSLSGVRSLAVVATKAPGQGSIKVYFGQTLLKSLSLTSSTVKKRQILPIASFPVARSGKVRLVVSSAGKAVRIEGLGVATR